MDAARCAKRMGADEVYIVYRRSEKELPARLEEIHHAKEEGVVFKFLTAPLEVLSDENFNVTGLKCQQMELGEPDASGRRRPIPVEGSEFVLDLDCVIAAIGTSPNPLIRHTTPGLDTNRKGCIVLMTSTASPPRMAYSPAAMLLPAQLPLSSPWAQASALRLRWTSTSRIRTSNFCLNMRKEKPGCALSRNLVLQLRSI